MDFLRQGRERYSGGIPSPRSRSSTPSHTNEVPILNLTKNTIAIGACTALLLTISACGKGVGDASPSTTTTTTTGGGSTPTPTPTATPTATPTTGTLSCTLPKLPNCDATCCTAGGSVIYRAELEAAEDDLTRTQPGLFTSNGNVRDNIQYMAALAKRLTERTGLCAEPLGHDEIRVKGNQDVSQHVDVLISDVTPWVGGAYTCRPASF